MSIAHIIKEKKGEHVIMILHRHPITFLPTIALFLVLFFVPIALFYMGNSLFPTLLDSAIAYPLLVLFASVYYLSIYLFFFAQFIDFYLDMWVITNERIVDIEQHSLFHRVITELELFRIQDATTNVQGIFPTLFNYGNVIVKTASNTDGIVFYNVPNPNSIRTNLIQFAEDDRKRHGFS